MKIRIHKLARTTPAIREEIRQSNLSERALAEKYGISRTTVRKWKQRQSVEDNSHRPHTIHTALSPLEEIFVVGLRRFLCLSLDDLHLTVQVFLHSNISRSALDRCLRRYGISTRRNLLEQCRRCPEKQKHLGELRINAVHLSPLLKSSQQHVLYLAVDSASNWLYAEIRLAHTATSFLQNLLARAPFQVSAVWTDASTEFTASTPSPTQAAPEEDLHPFSLLCRQQNLIHRMQEVAATASPAQALESLLAEHGKQGARWSLSECRELLFDFCSFFNTELPLKRLRNRSPLQTIQRQWNKEPLSALDTRSQMTTDWTQHSYGHRSLEEEELIQLRHVNRHLRLQQVLLARNKASSDQDSI